MKLNFKFLSIKKWLYLIFIIKILSFTFIRKEISLFSPPIYILRIHNRSSQTVPSIFGVRSSHLQLGLAPKLSHSSQKLLRISLSRKMRSKKNKIIFSQEVAEALYSFLLHVKSKKEMRTMEKNPLKKRLHNEDFMHA